MCPAVFEIVCRLLINKLLPCQLRILKCSRSQWLDRSLWLFSFRESENEERNSTVCKKVTNSLEARQKVDTGLQAHSVTVTLIFLMWITKYIKTTCGENTDQLITIIHWSPQCRWGSLLDCLTQSEYMMSNDTIVDLQYADVSCLMLCLLKVNFWITSAFSEITEHKINRFCKVSFWRCSSATLPSSSRYKIYKIYQIYNLLYWNAILVS